MDKNSYTKIEHVWQAEYQVSGEKDQSPQCHKYVHFELNDIHFMSTLTVRNNKKPAMKTGISNLSTQTIKAGLNPDFPRPVAKF